MKTKPLFPPGTRLDSDRVTAYLNHLQAARLARLAYARGAFKNATRLAKQAGVCPSTASRFLGADPGRATRDPRTSTTRKVMSVLGYRLALVEEDGQ